MPGRRAVLVDDDRHVLVRLAELSEERCEILRLGDDIRRMEELLELAGDDVAVLEGGDQGADVENPDDVVERVAVHRVPGVRRFEHAAQCLVRRQVDGQAHDVGPRHHDVRGLLLREVEDLEEHLLLGRLDLADVLGRRDRLADVVAGAARSSRPGPA